MSTSSSASDSSGDSSSECRDSPRELLKLEKEQRVLFGNTLASQRKMGSTCRKIKRSGLKSTVRSVQRR